MPLEMKAEVALANPTTQTPPTPHHFLLTSQAFTSQRVTGRNP
jgi:hypothetical protein